MSKAADAESALRVTLTDTQVRHQMRWVCGDHSGTIRFPQDERGPVRIEWDSTCPDNWEKIEKLVEGQASMHCA